MGREGRKDQAPGIIAAFHSFPHKQADKHKSLGSKELLFSPARRWRTPSGDFDEAVTCALPSESQSYTAHIYISAII